MGPSHLKVVNIFTPVFLRLITFGVLGDLGIACFFAKQKEEETLHYRYLTLSRKTDGCGFNNAILNCHGLHIGVGVGDSLWHTNTRST